MVARILEVAPETEPIDIAMRSRWEEPAPLNFCSELAPFVVDAVRRGDRDLALRIVRELDAGLTSGDGFAFNCVAVGFLEPQYERTDDLSDRPPPRRLGFHDEEMADFVASWPSKIKTELRRQIAYEERVRRKQERDWIPQPDGSFRLSLRWQLRHPIRYWRMRRGGIGWWVG